MTRIALRFGELDVPGCEPARSSLRWLRPDGYACRAREIVAFCNILVNRREDQPFAEERFDLQVAFAPRRAGVLRHVAARSRGGYLDRLPFLPWDADAVWAHIDDPVGEAPGDPQQPHLLFLAGRRFTEIAEDRSGLLTGWHDRTRAWWGEGEGATVIGLGTCEQDGILRGSSGTFAEPFEELAGPAHLILGQDEPLVPCAAVLAEQIGRTAVDRDAIREDMARSFPAGSQPPSAREWLFMGALLNALESAPLAERSELLTRSGLRNAAPPNAACLSLTAEPARAMRHRRLGYTVNIHDFRLTRAGPAVSEWLRDNFESEPRPIEAVAADYRRLAAAAPKTRLFVVNRLSTQNFEEIQSYAGLDDETMARLGTVRAKELNLMLDDVAREIGIGIVDADVIAAGLGTREHLPDGTHGSGLFYREVRKELFRQLGIASRS